MISKIQCCAITLTFYKTCIGKTIRNLLTLARSKFVLSQKKHVFCIFADYDE